MVKAELVKLKDSYAQGIMLPAPGGQGHPNMLVVECRKGYLMCGYLNLSAADKFGDAAVLVGGADFDAILANPIKGMTAAAKDLGVKEGMTGEQAAEVLNS